MNARLGRGMRMLLPVLTAFALTLAAVAASAEPDRPLSVRAPRAASAVGQASVTACNPKASSLRPSGPLQVTPGSFMEKIRARGYLIAGVDQNTFDFGFRNPFDGQIEGFDIDMIKAVARYIGVTKVEYKAISDDQRIPDVENGAVDIVAHTMTILCDRLKYVDFSSVYFDAGQRVLVLKSSAARSLTALAGQKVCATTGSDSLARIIAARAIPVRVPYWTDCLVLLQQGDVAAISTDDTILDGLKAQDPWTMLVGSRLSAEPYGLAISKQHPEFVRFVNAVLEQLRTDGQWAASYRAWIGSPAPAPPRAEYAD